MRISDWSSDVCSSDLGNQPSWRDLQAGESAFLRGRRKGAAARPETVGRSYGLPHGLHGSTGQHFGWSREFHHHQCGQGTEPRPRTGNTVPTDSASHAYLSRELSRLAISPFPCRCLYYTSDSTPGRRAERRVGEECVRTGSSRWY